MVKKKPNKKISGKSKKTQKTARKAKVRTQSKSSSRKQMSGKKAGRTSKKKRSSRSASKEIHSLEPSTLSGRTFATQRAKTGIVPRSAGQSGDVQGLSRKTLVDSESVEELLEEGQALEAAAISGVEDAPDPDEDEVHTREVPEDDVPEEYLDED